MFPLATSLWSPTSVADAVSSKEAFRKIEYLQCLSIVINKNL